MNLEYVWWIVALVLAGGGVIAFLAFGHVPEFEDDAADGGLDAADGGLDAADSTPRELPAG